LFEEKVPRNKQYDPQRKDICEMHIQEQLLKDILPKERTKKREILKRMMLEETPLE